MYAITGITGTVGTAVAGALLAAGERVRGHEFHYTNVEATTSRQTAPASASAPAPAWTLSARGSERPEGFVHGGVQASYLHVHWAAYPEIPARFVAAAGN